VVVPVKAFGQAKARLAAALPPEGRAELARTMAEVVLDAAAPLGVVVACGDEDVAAWARGRGAAVAWAPGTDLNGALRAAVDRSRDAGIARVVIAHADLPFASGLARLADAGPDEVLAVADRHGRGTNVMSLPTDAGMELCFGPGSLAAHRAAAQAAGLRFVEVDEPALAWDVDEPADLDPPAALGPRSAITTA
jgi:2-phospho-L-lactate guanylyltransferase